MQQQNPSPPIVADLRPVHAAGVDEIRAAEREHQDAKNLLAALEERVREGDPDVRSEELREARGLVQFAALRIDTARRHAAQLATEARHALYIQAGAEARTFDRSDDPLIESAFAEALAALRNLYEVADRRQASLLALIAQAEPIVAEAEEHGEKGMLDAAGIRAVGMGATGSRGILVRHEDGAGHHLSNLLPYRAAFAVVGRLLRDVGRTMRGQGEPYMPWYGDDVSFAANAFTLATREFPGLDTVEPPQRGRRQHDTTQA